MARGAARRVGGPVAVMVAMVALASSACGTERLSAEAISAEQLSGPAEETDIEPGKVGVSLTAESLPDSRTETDATAHHDTGADPHPLAERVRADREGSDEASPDPFRTYVVTARSHVDRLEAFVSPGGPLFALPFAVPNPHQFGGPLTLMVVEGGPGDEWLRVQLPVRPNGQEAWVRASDYVLGETRVRAEVDLGDVSVRVFDGEELIAESPAVVGATGTPTPLGRFYVAAKKVNSAEEYYLGPSALVLSGFSEALETFGGGLPVIAIHGTHRPADMGEETSFGCVRVPNEVIEFLDEHVPIGAPVDVVT